jgi:hypothetical protein
MKRDGTKPVPASDDVAVVTMAMGQRVGKRRRPEPSECGIGILLERRVATSSLRSLLKRRPQSWAVVETCAEAFRVADSAASSDTRCGWSLRCDLSCLGGHFMFETQKGQIL